jgi:RHS repeat-associated protein
MCKSPRQNCTAFAVYTSRSRSAKNGTVKFAPIPQKRAQQTVNSGICPRRLSTQSGRTLLLYKQRPNRSLQPVHLKPIEMKQSNLRNCLIAFALFAVVPFAHGQQTVNLVTHEYRNPDGSCTPISFDGAVVHVLAQVGADAPPGDYIYATSPSGPNQPGGNVDVRVNSDHTFAYVGNNDTFFPAWNASAGPGTEVISLMSGPPGAQHSEGTVTFTTSFACDNQYFSTRYDVYVPVTIGTPVSIGAEHTKANDPKRGGDLCPGSTAPQPQMALYSAHAMLASLNIEDTPIHYAPPRGPTLDVTVTYSQREGQQPATFNYSNLGPKWTFNWMSYVTDDPNNSAANASVYLPRGGVEGYSGFNSGTQSYTADAQSHAVLVRTSSTTYERRLPDGSKQVFGPTSNGSSSFPRLLFMTQVIDAANNPVTITYDSGFPTTPRISRVTDALGTHNVTFAYELSGDSLKITKITDPFGRYAQFNYTNGQLTSITDPIGIQSVFIYSTDGTNFINSLHTPYGTSSFATDQNTGTNHWVEMTDPLGGKERVEYRDNAPNINDSDPAATVPTGFTNSGLAVANTFFWDKKATQLYPPVNGVYDYTKARITHWTKNADGSPSGIAASDKKPLENRVWYAYQGQSDTNHAGITANPSQVARVLDDSTTQLSQYQYNSLGNTTKATDPIGRVTSYHYDANSIDLLTVFQERSGGASTDDFGAAADKIASYTYNSLHEPLTATDAAGQTTNYSYRPDGHGQLQSVQNAKGETATYGYGPVTGVPADYLASITSPPFNNTSAVTSFTYDSANRVQMVTNQPDGYAVTTSYDNLDRPTQITYPDGTNQQFQYSQNFGQGVTTILDLTKSIDRRGRTTTRHYNANRQMDLITDPLGRQTAYNWCTCGALTSITDPRNKTTSFNRDLQSRVTSKIFADTTSMSYVYENTTSRLKSMTDAIGYVTPYSYFKDDDLKQVTNTGAPTVNFTYDSNYNRVTSMIDGTGTTNYGYYPVANPPTLGATQLQTVDGPIPNTPVSDVITYTYDPLGRALSQMINGTTSSVTYDSLGRLATSDNALGHFSRGYVGVTPRLQTLTYPASTGQTANYAYFDNSHDRRLQTLQNLGPSSANISKFDYTYDSEGQILTWVKQFTNQTGVSATLGYDLADQITSATNTTMGNSSYGYDLGANRTSDELGTHTFNNVNQTQDLGYTYDANGNLTSDGLYNYGWDGLNRLVVIEQIIPGGGSGFAAVKSSPSPSPTPKKLKRRRVLASSHNVPQGATPLGGAGGFPPPTVTYTRSTFAYDGLNRRARVTEQQDTRQSTDTSPPNWVQITDRKYIWSGNTIAEERDASTYAVTRRFFAEGEQINGVNYYFTRDHLGSVRELTSSTGQLVEKYDYDPYGNQPTNDVVGGHGGGMADFGFTGHWFHGPSGLSLSLYRAYDPSLGRWLSRDPIGEAGGINLYGYVANHPTKLIDPLGLVWYEDLAKWARSQADYYERKLDFNLPWQIAGTGDLFIELAAGLLSTPDAISHLGEGTGTWSVDPCWENSPGLFMDISLTSGILAGGLAPTEIGNSSIGLKGADFGTEITFTRPGAATPDLRINFLGDWDSTNPNAQLFHYHRRPGIGKHRPWEGW